MIISIISFLNFFKLENKIKGKKIKTKSSIDIADPFDNLILFLYDSHFVGGIIREEFFFFS